jgi:UDP-3-O-[3-hydroxymyristoyl] N-acetylglucosamine deacetylase/3-hydroxyacyl-[acyl-carrier-protein] dehydratase
VERATTIGEGNAKVQTVEHCISALYGLGIDNAVVEMDANEAPIADGSAAPYVELIDKAGIVEQDAPSRIYEVPETLHVETKGGSLMTVVPDTKLRISCTQVGNHGRNCQFLSLEITPEIYREAIAPARTFVYYEDIKPLMDKGLIKGGSLENAVVIREENIMSKEPLRFEDEFVRHKILDIIGDIALLGRHVRGHIIAVRAGHGANAELTRAIEKSYKQMQAMVPPVKIPKGEAVLDVKEVMKILPHRYPFLMVDRVIGFEGDNKLTAVKSVTINEPFFQGHFPGHPVMPGVLQVEAMAQVASILMMRQGDNRGKIGYFMSADKVKFRKPVFPGDTLFITGELTKVRRNMGSAICYCEVNNEVVSQAELMFALMDRA